MINFIDLKRRWEYLGLSDLDIVKTAQPLIARVFYICTPVPSVYLAVQIRRDLCWVC